MRDFWRPWRAPRWGGRILVAIAVIASLVAASVSVLASSPRQAPLTSSGTPLPLPSSAPASTPGPQAVTPSTGLPSPTILSPVGADELVALTSTSAAVSSRGGAWVQIPVPSGVSGLVADPVDAKSFAAGGVNVQTTSDGGKHWAATHAQPSTTGPFVPLLISPWDSRVLFVSHQDRIAVTTDAGSTWHDVAVPAGAQPVMTSGNTAGTFFVAVGGNTYQLFDDGAKVSPEPSLPGGAVATSLGAGPALLVAWCSNDHVYTLKGARWTPAPITAAIPVVVDGSDLWAVVPVSGANGPDAVEESSDGGASWQARPGLPAGEGVRSLARSADGHTVYALDSIGEVYESRNGIWYLLSTGLQFVSPPA